MSRNYMIKPPLAQRVSTKRRTSPPRVKKWAFALIKDGVVMRSNCVSGFATREDAEAAARNALAKVTL